MDIRGSVLVYGLRQILVLLIFETILYFFNEATYFLVVLQSTD